MSYIWLQNLILLLCLSSALWHVSGRVLPRGRARLQQWLAVQLMAPGLPVGCNRLGLRLLPQMGAQACGTGCSSCGICPTN